MNRIALAWVLSLATCVACEQTSQNPPGAPKCGWWGSQCGSACCTKEEMCVRVDHCEPTGPETPTSGLGRKLRDAGTD